MEDYDKLKDQLEELRIDILNYTNNEIEPQDLREQFYKVKETDPATYELLVLIYDEFQKTHKVNKKQFQEMLDKALTIKTATIDKMILERGKFIPWSQRLYNFVTWKNTFRLFALWVSILAVLMVLYKIDKEAFDALSNNTFKVFDKVEKIAK